MNKMNLSETFLYRLFKADKLLFAIGVIFILSTCYCAIRRTEQFPFLLYGMYSVKVPPEPAYYAYSITIGGQEIKYAKLRDAQRELISTTLENTLELIDSGKISKEDEIKFKNWLMDYCIDRRMTGENMMDIYRLTCTYDNQGRIKVTDKKLVYSYAVE